MAITLGSKWYPVGGSEGSEGIARACNNVCESKYQNCYGDIISLLNV